MTHGVDYATDHPDPGTLARLGVEFACRYLTGKTAGKAITPAELDGLHGAGLAMVAGYETTGVECRGGRPAGVTHGRLALSAADQLGVPADRPIYFAVDFDLQPEDVPAMVDYFLGIASVMPADRIGIYGGLRAIQSAQAHSCAGWFWQTYAWSAGQWANRLHLRQIRNGISLAGGTVDLDEAMTLDYGGWEPVTIVDLSPASVQAIVTSLLTADKIPHGQTPTNPTWQVANSIGWTLALDEAQAPTVAQLYTLLTGTAPTVLPAGVDQAHIDAALAARPGFLSDLARAVWALEPPAGPGMAVAGDTPTA